MSNLIKELRSVISELLVTIRSLIEREKATNDHLIEVEEQLLLETYTDIAGALANGQRCICVEEELLKNTLNVLSVKSRSKQSIDEIAMKIINSPSGPDNKMLIPNTVLYDTISLLVEVMKSSTCQLTQAILDKLKSIYDDWKSGQRKSHIQINEHTVSQANHHLKRFCDQYKKSITAELLSNVLNSGDSNIVSVSQDTVRQLTLLLSSNCDSLEFKKLQSAIPINNDRIDVAKSIVVDLLGMMPPIRKSLCEDIQNIIINNFDSDNIEIPKTIIKQLKLVDADAELEQLISNNETTFDKTTVAKVMSILKNTPNNENNYKLKTISDELQSIADSYNNHFQSFVSKKPDIIKELKVYQQYSRNESNDKIFKSCESLPEEFREQLWPPCVKGRKIHFNAGTQTISDKYQPEGVIKNPRKRWKIATHCIIAVNRLKGFGMSRKEYVRQTISRLRYRTCVDGCAEAKLSELEERNLKMSKEIARLRSNKLYSGDQIRTPSRDMKPHPPPPLFSTAGQHRNREREQTSSRMASKKRFPISRMKLPSPIIASLVAVPQHAMPAVVKFSPPTSHLPSVLSSSKPYTISIPRPQAAVSNTEYLPMLQGCILSTSDVAVTSPFHRPPTFGYSDDGGVLF